MDPEPVINLENVSFAYQDAPVLKEVSIKIYPGEFVGVIGPNGGGKTTLLQLILGFLKPLSGKIEVFGGSPHSARLKLGYVPQVARFDRQFPISVFELVLSGRLAHLPWYGYYSKADKQAALDALDLMGLSLLKDHSFGTLSGGQAQRALIARALASDPELLILDEPTASVDSKAEADIYAILRKFAGDKTILMVTHDLKAAIDVVQQVICVQLRAVPLKPQEVCEHFAFGLYHKPLL